MFQDVVGASEVQFFVFVRNGVWPAAKIFGTVAINPKNFGPVGEERVNLWICREDTILIEIFVRFGIFSGTETGEASLIARLECVIQTASTTESTAIEVDEKIISILTEALMHIKSNRRAVKTSSTSLLRKQIQSEIFGVCRYEAKGEKKYKGNG